MRYAIPIPLSFAIRIQKHERKSFEPLFKPPTARGRFLGSSEPVLEQDGISGKAAASSEIVNCQS
jgi:hypothetical protein